MTQGDPYPPPATRVEFEELLQSSASEDRLRAAMASFRMDDPLLAPLLARRLVAEGNNLVKATLVKAVGRFGDLDHLELVAGYLSDPDPRVRANTVEAMGCFKTPQVVQLVSPLVQDESSRVRGNALLVMGKFHREKTLAYVNQMALAPDPALRETAVYVLSRIAGEYGVSRLVALMQREPVPELKRGILGALVALQRRGDPAAVAAIGALQQAQAGAVPPPPAAASAPLVAPAPVAVDPGAGGHEASPGEEPAEAPLPDGWPDSSPSRVQQQPVRYPQDLSSGIPRRRLEAIQLAPDSGEEVFELLKNLITKELDEFVIATLVKKLGKVGGTAVVPLIMSFIRSPDGRVRANCIEGLEAAGDPQLVSVAQAMLADTHPRVRAQAARILASRSSDQGKAVAVLKEMLLEGDESGALSAIHALEAIDATVILEIMELALVQPQPRLRARVLMALKVMGEKNDLAARLHQKYSGGEAFEDEEYVGRLLARMNSKDEEVRYEALRRLSLVRSQRVQSRIELATSDASEKVRNLAKAVVEDFGKAYKRQGVLHSLGLRVAEALRRRELQLEGEEDPLAELEAVTQELMQGEEGTAAASSLLARRREHLVGLGERVYREHAGLTLEGIRELLAQLLDLEDKPAPEVPVAATEGPSSQQVAATAGALQDAMSELKEGYKTGAGSQMGSVAASKDLGERLGGLGATKIPKQVFMMAGFLFGVGALGLFVSSQLQSGLMGNLKPWIVPAEGDECYVAQADGFVFATTPRGDLFSVAAPSGNVKWKHPIENLSPKQLLARDHKIYLTTKLDQVLCIAAGKGVVLWSRPTGGAILGGMLLAEDNLILAVKRSDGQHEVRSLSPQDGSRRWSFDSPTGRPGSMTVQDDSLYVTTAATIFRLGLDDGKERFSYDHGDDFVSQGRMAVSEEGAVLASAGKRVLAIGTSGIPTGEWEAKGRLRYHPLRIAANRFAVFQAQKVTYLDERLEVVSEEKLPFTPSLWVKGENAWFFSDGSVWVYRVSVDKALQVDGKARGSGTVVSLVPLGEGVVAGALNGFGMYPPASFQ